MIDRDPLFPFPDYRGLEVTVQDCWRTRERRKEQDAVRSLLRKMNIRYMENDRNHENTDFCGSTLYREQPAKNSTLAPRHYVEQARGKFTAHTLEEQTAIMQDYCRRYQTDTVVCYCHYCLEGLLQGSQKPRSKLRGIKLVAQQSCGVLTLAAGLHFVSVGADHVPPTHSTAKWTCKHFRLARCLRE